MNEKYIRKSSWSAIFGAVKDAFTDEGFHTAVGDVSGQSKENRQSVARRDGREGKKPMLTETPAFKVAENSALALKAADALAFHRNGQDAKRIAAIEERVNKNALELRSALRGSYPGDAEVARSALQDTSGRRRSSSTMPVRRFQGSQRPALEGVPSSWQRETASLDSRMSRSSSARPYAGMGRQDLPSLEGYPQVPTRDSKASQQKAPRPPQLPAGRCDKCDGRHDTDACPNFKNSREKHKDAWANYGAKSPKQLGASSGIFVLRSGRCVRQPGDGNCLFHSLCFGLNDGRSGRPLSAGELRGQLATFVAQHPRLDIAGDSLEEWVKWDTNSSTSTYASRMSRGGWGGGIEMAACSLLKNVNVHVYEKRSGAFKRISCFDCPGRASKTIHVLYQGGVHYDALVPLE